MDSSRRIVRRTSAAAELSNILHPVLARLYAARAVHHADELDLSLERLLPPSALKHMSPLAQAAPLNGSVSEQGCPAFATVAFWGADRPLPSPVTSTSPCGSVATQLAALAP